MYQTSGKFISDSIFAKHTQNGKRLNKTNTQKLERNNKINETNGWKRSHVQEARSNHVQRLVKAERFLAKR